MGKRVRKNTVENGQESGDGRELDKFTKDTPKLRYFYPDAFQLSSTWQLFHKV